MEVMDVIDASGACVIVGGGLAGLTAALSLTPRPVILLSKVPLGCEIIERPRPRRDRREPWA